MFKEFREFIIKGNMIDMAIGIVLGVAFGGLISSLVEDILMPPIGLLLGKVDFSNLFINLSGQDYASLEAAVAAGAPIIRYGVFLNSVINLVIVGFALFLVVKAVNQVRRPQAEPVPETKDCPYCLSGIPLKATRCPHCTSEVPAS